MHKGSTSSLAMAFSKLSNVLPRDTDSETSTFFPLWTASAGKHILFNGCALSCCLYSKFIFTIYNFIVFFFIFYPLNLRVYSPGD